MHQDRRVFLSFCGLSYPLVIVGLVFLFAHTGACSQESWKKDALLYQDTFDSEALDNWQRELEKPEVSVVKPQDGKLNIDVGGGATIWFKHKLQGDVLIEYDVTVIQNDGANDRVSDLNQFWMASDPANTNLFTRSGTFSQYDNLRLYYAGMGGNNNSTTRFRRYPGGGERPLLDEHTDREHLLQPNSHYHIEIVCFRGLTQFRANGEVFHTFIDPDPLVAGHFGFRTVKNHETIDNFKVHRLVETEPSTSTQSVDTAGHAVSPGESTQDAIDHASDSINVSSSRIVTTEKTAPLQFFVSLEGNDTWSGKLERPSSQGGNGPLRTMEAARDAIRNLPLEKRAIQPIEVCILPGTYLRKQPLSLDARDSGTENAPVIYRSWTDKPVVFSGGKEVRNWTNTELNGNSVRVADLSELPEGYAPFEQLWVNGHRAVQARTPNRGYLKIPSASEIARNSSDRGKTYDFSYIPADEHYFDEVQDGVAVVFNKWLEYHMPLDRIDRKSRLVICSKQSGRAIEADDDYYLEGGRAMLDQPGEWYLDRKAHNLYYYPLAGESEFVAVIPSLVTVLNVEGDADSGKWAEHIHFRGLTFSHTTWVLPRSSGPSGFSQADIRMDGAVRLLDARECLFEGCEITAIGNYGFEIGPGCSENRILHCDIHDLGGGGFLIGPKIRPPSDKVNPNRQDFPPVLEHPSDACSHNEIADCRIYDGGRYYHCAVGIWIGQSPDNHVHNNEIYDFYYSAISSGWTWGYGRALATGNRFEYNLIHHIGRRRDGDGPVLSDLGGIYTLGDQTGTVIRHNVFHDIWAGKYGGWAIYCDEGSRNILIENNLAYRCRHSCFDQHYGKDNIIRNNIFAFADTSVVMLARAQAHTGFVLTNNILLSDGTPIYAGGYEFKVNTRGAFKADHNLVWSTTGQVLGAQDRFPSRLYEPNESVLSWEQWQALGYDQHTIIADPGFKDPANGDFRLSESSPAIKIGFKPFALDKAGPR